MAKEVYNLQVPIDIELSEMLKKLADEDDRTLRAYCKRILQDHVKNTEKELISNIDSKVNADIKEEIEENGQPTKIRKVGKLTKK